MELTGQATTHIKQYDNPQFALHSEAAEAYFDMKKSAHEDGIILHPFSSFRNFKSQLRVWNLKFTGKRPLYTADGDEISFSGLSQREIVNNILNWSAIPGASRHHWGTDIDLIDLKHIPQGYQIRLLPEETREGGVFYNLHCWLDKNMEKFGFFRPYSRFQGGVFAEPWHVSYGLISKDALKQLTCEILEQAIKESAVLGRDLVLERLSEIYANYVINVTD